MLFCVISFSLLTGLDAGRQTDPDALSSSCQEAASGNHTDVDWNTEDPFFLVWQVTDLQDLKNDRWNR